VVIPTYRRGAILLDTLNHLQALDPAPCEILVVDQTESPGPEMADALAEMEASGQIRWLRHSPPSIPQSMNHGLLEAKGDVVLFMDDDVIPQLDLIAHHVQVYQEYPEAWAVAGRILQPEDPGRDGEEAASSAMPVSCSALRTNLQFPFNGTEAAWVQNVMAGNLSVRRAFFLDIGGFDARFIPPVSFRFESEFARRLVAAGGKIRFEPRACLRHLRAGSGGTRSGGAHLASASPLHGVGDYYYALRWGKGWDRIRYMARRPFREVCTRFHLKHPWAIPVKLIGEVRAMALAFRLHKAGPQLITKKNEGEGLAPLRIVLVSTAAPDRPDGSMVRYGGMVREALEQFGGDEVEIKELNLAPTQAWLNRFPKKLQTPIRYARIAAAARRLLSQQRDGVLHLLDGSHAYLLDAAGPLSVPVVSTVHDLIPVLRLQGELGLPPPGRVGSWLIHRTLSGLKRADAWIADSGSTRDDVVRLAGAPAERVHVVHPAVIRVELIAPAVQDPASVPMVLHVAGNNTFYKNRIGVIDIFKSLYQSEEVVLKMVGAPPDAALRAKVKQSGVASAIEFCPHVSEPELAALYRSSAFLLFPSLYEGFGWPPLEAMAQGCPVVCSNTGSLPEVVGDAALMGAPEDIHGLASHGLRLLRDPEFRAQQTERGHQQIRRFSMEALATGLLAAYRSVEAHS